MRQFHRSKWTALLLVVPVLLLAACGSDSMAITAKQEIVVTAQVQQEANGNSEQDNLAEAAPEDASGHDDSEADAGHDDSEADAGDDSMAVAMAHDIPKQAASVSNPIAFDEDSVAVGAELFSQTCIVCHGPKGKGDGPGAAGLDPKPASLIADHVQANTDGALFYTISNGRPDTAMVSWSATYSETERWHLVNFIRSLAAE